jgi:hypothetical protein
VSDQGYVDSGIEPSVVAQAPDVRRMVLSEPQTRGFTAMDRYLSLEGAYRSAKTTTALLKVGHWCWEYPGIPWLLSRWTDEATFSQLRPAFLELWGDRVYKWLADERCYLLYSKDSETKGIYSRVYFTGLRPSEGTSPFSKIHGKKFACALIDQPEECPEQYFDHMRTRLSAPGFPQQLVLCPNPQIKTHWLSVEFPEDNSRRDEGYYLVKFRMRDNVIGLGEDYVAQRERELRHKPAEYRRALLGERGLPFSGKPIFGDVFRRDYHANERVEFNPALPLYESLDYGHRHPAVTWTQYPAGRMHILAGVMGDDMLLEKFVPAVEKIRQRWFPGLEPSMLQWTADPAGSARNSQGTQSGVKLLADLGVFPYVVPGANQPPIQDAAIQTIGGYLERSWYDGSPTFRVDPERFVIVDKHGRETTDSVLVDGFEVGFVWDDDKTYGNTQYPHVRPWKRDKWFEHPFATLLYSVVAYAPPDPADAAGVIRNPDAIRRARRALEATSTVDSHTGAKRYRTEREIVDAIHGRDQRRIIEARLENARQKEESRALRQRQRDDRRDDGRPEFHWTGYASGLERSYFNSRRGVGARPTTRRSGI